MKKIYILVVVLFSSLFNVEGKYLEGSKFLTFTGGWTIMNIQETSNKIGGFDGGLSLDQTSLDGKWGIGVAYSYITVIDEVDNARAMYRTTPFTFQGKYFFKGEFAKVFLQMNVGFHHSKIEWDGRQTLLQDWDMGVVLGGGAGIQYFFNERIYMTAGVTLKWLQNSYYTNGLLNGFHLGIGYQFP